jgi:excinuclease ABC subunit A
MIMPDVISVRGAREHNLKNIDLEIPKNKLVVFTGVSGSGKTSLAMDTIFAEGQRRYVESLTSYARQFLGVLKKPDVERIDGLSPAIAIDQKGISHNPRSTVGTVTEIYDYLRLLFARIGHPHCPNCKEEIAPQSAQQIADQVLSWPINKKRGLRLMILSPVVHDRKGEYSTLLANLKKQGYTQVRVDGQVSKIDTDLVLIKTNRHDIDVVVDKLVVKRVTKESKRRLTDSLEKALRLADGLVIVSKIRDRSFDLPTIPKNLEDKLYSEKYACPNCNISLPELEPRMFSFNSPQGACPSCEGLGSKLRIDSDLIVNPRLSVNEGGILPWSKVLERSGWWARVIRCVAKAEEIDLDARIGKLPPKDLKKLLYGTGGKRYRIEGKNRHGEKTLFSTHFEGVIPNLERRYRQTDSDYIRREIEKYMVNEPCPSCKGSRLRDEALSVTIRGRNLSDVTKMMIKNTQEWALMLKQKQNGLTEKEQQIARPIMEELVSRLKFLNDVGLSYLSLDRPARTLSSGESQRIRLASQIGTGLSGVLYVLDEPSVGLHQRDQSRLINTLKRLRDLGNSVLVVEHDEATIRAADWLVDFGPGAGEQGGQVVAEGTPTQIEKNKNSLTGQYLSGKRKVQSAKVKGTTQSSKVAKLTIIGCREHNLKNITVEIPLGKLVCVTGVSGSGKSTLVNDTLYRALRAHFGLKIAELPGDYDQLTGTEQIDKLVNIDQSPIGRTPRSNPTTYTKTFDDIRHLFSQTKEAKIRGYSPGRFSFNVKGGRCEACQGEGQLKIEMQFLPDVYVNCELCKGARYNSETLQVRYKGQTIADVLEMSIDEARKFFAAIPTISRRLQTMIDVGLGYIKLGQPAPTLSGGEAQRIKLSRELGKRQTGKTFYLLDEPTTGLHFEDLNKLLSSLRRLVDVGNTVLVIEHNLDVIRNADWIIDLGPEGGDEGGKIVAEGTVEDIIRHPKSYTGKALKNFQ